MDPLVTQIAAEQPVIVRFEHALARCAVQMTVADYCTHVAWNALISNAEYFARFYVK